MSMLELLLSPNYVTSFLPAYTDSKFPRSEKGTCSRNPKDDEARRRPKELFGDIPTLYLPQDPREAYLRVVQPIISIDFSLERRLGFNAESQPRIKLFY